MPMRSHKRPVTIENLFLAATYTAHLQALLCIASQLGTALSCTPLTLSVTRGLLKRLIETLDIDAHAWVCRRHVTK